MGSAIKQLPETRAKEVEPSIAELVASLAHLLPEQAPLHAFVHHNTLHAFEHLPFEQAVVEAGGIFGTEAFQSEQAFAGHWKSGRIAQSDIDAVVKRECTDSGDVFPGGISRVEFCRNRLQHIFEVPQISSIEYIRAETDLVRAIAPEVTPDRAEQIETEQQEQSTQEFLSELWHTFLSVAKPVPSQGEEAGPRQRDQILAEYGVDTDKTVHPLLIRTTAAFLDQGVAYWEMPGRTEGFLRAFRRLYSERNAPIARDLRGLRDNLSTQESENWSAETTIEWALDKLEISKEQRKACLRETLLSLRGWAGMVHHLEIRPDRAPVWAPPARLLDFVAVQLTLDTIVAENVLKTATINVKKAKVECTTDLALVYESFLCAQYMPVSLRALCEKRNAEAWVREVRALSSMRRRWLMHLAYEHQHRVEVLDGLRAHTLLSEKKLPTAVFQAAFCIDDREESLRRHLEECFPQVDTYGYAGFYGVAMNYQGLEDVHSRPLCPVSIRPRHLIIEKAIDKDEESVFRSQRKKVGLKKHRVDVASKTLTRGGLWAMIIGPAAIVPLVFRSLFPRIAGRMASKVETRIQPPATRLQIEHFGPPVVPMQEGYLVEEMTDIVRNAISTMGVHKLCSIFLVVGHGSSSLNNPHEAAHDCGATGGGRGGSNARAFAAMANHPGVRAQLKASGHGIPDSTWFVGAYHNTCDDRMTYYDEDLVPDDKKQELATIREAMAEACLRDAHERCRRFETAPARLDKKRAEAFAHIHANDLAEPRPEYGHATNAVCIVGRRERTRGLFLDRRAFLVSYDPTSDDDGEILRALLVSVGPVGAGINLEYYFSFVDPSGYGSGTKLPHNITGLLGVMDGHATDLRTGLPWQMVEIHEPVRLLNIIEAAPERLGAILEKEPGLAQLIQNQWIQVVAWNPESEEMHVYTSTGFERYEPSSHEIPILSQSQNHYSAKRHHLPPAHIRGNESVSR